MVIKRILVFFLIIVLVISPVSVYASSAGSVVVAGGSIATGGLASGYAEKTEKTAITLSMALLYSLGVTVKLTSEAISAGKTAYDFVRDKFAQWVGGTSAEELTESEREELKKRFQVINGGGGSEDPDQQPDNGFNVGPDGKIYCSPATITMLKKFIDWLESTGQINNVPTSSGIYNTFYGSALYINNNPDIYIRTYEFLDDSVPQDCYFGQFKPSSDATEYLYFVFKNDRIWIRARSDSGSVELSARGMVNDFIYSISDWGILRISSNQPTAGVIDISQYGYYGQSGVEAYLRQLTPSDPEVPDGLYKDGNYNTDALDNPDNNQTVIDPGLIPTIANDNPDKEYQVSADDYIEAIRQVLNEKTNPADVPEQLPVTDVPTGVTVPVNIPADHPAEWPITTPSSPTATPDVPTGSTPVVDPATPADPETAMPKLTFPLDQYFPFCIPFDVYALLSKFSAEPVTPVFDVGFIEPFTNSEVNLHIDLTPWNGVATAIRTAELGAFIVGLALLSKQIFTRG